jgi:hypothetical protein
MSPVRGVRDESFISTLGGNMSTSMLQRLRAAAFRLQVGLCCYCDEPMWLADQTEFQCSYGLTARQSARYRCTAEHLMPRSEGGADAAANIAASCVGCNVTRHRRKRVLSPPEWREVRLARLLKHPDMRLSGQRQRDPRALDISTLGGSSPLGANFIRSSFYAPPSLHLGKARNPSP